MCLKELVGYDYLANHFLYQLHHILSAQSVFCLFFFETTNFRIALTSLTSLELLVEEN